MSGIVIGEHPGYIGMFTVHQMAQAIPNGSRVRKTRSEPNDGNPDGTLGTVLGSMSHPEVMDGTIFYFIEWDTMPKIACGVMEWKILPAASH